MKAQIIILAVIVLSSSLFAQSIYEIPFASKGNIIELEIGNDTRTNIENILIKLEEFPEWVNFNIKDVVLANNRETAKFVFDITEDAKQDEASSLQFTLTKNGQLLGEKRIQIKVLPPKEYKLFQNYPNPFNPSTIIRYSIPQNEKDVTVKLIIFDILGREVRTLVNQKQQPGNYKVEFNATNLSS